MQSQNNDTKAFLALVRTGLWADAESTDIRNLGFAGSVDWKKVHQLAAEQSVQGLALQGLEWYKEHKAECITSLSQDLLLQWIVEVQMLEHQNEAMNHFVADLIEKMRDAGIYALLIKGQGIAQCYERPLWRVCGDVDLLLDDWNYEKAKIWFEKIGQISEEENKFKKHISYRVDSWNVELHGTMRGELGRKIDNVLDKVQRDVFHGGNVRSWTNGNSSIFLPAPDNDVIFVFAHILQHFFRGGIGLRQICDWCRLLWTYKDTLDSGLLESRIRKIGLMSEWKAFSAFAVDFLGVPADAMPLYSPAAKWKKKSKRIFDYVMEVGNFGFNRDLSYKTRVPFIIRMIKSLHLRTGDFTKQVRVFPIDSVRAIFHVWETGFKVVGNKLIRE